MAGLIVAILAGCASLTSALAATPPDTHDSKAWIATSNGYTDRLLAVQLEHRPERGSRQGLAKYDERISSPTLADEMS